MVALSNELAEYINAAGNVNRVKIHRITSYRAPLAKMRSDERLEPVATKFYAVIKAVEQGNLSAVVSLTQEAMALASGVET
ncbi:hypothetical protein [Sporosarcina sp. A2]|uniref:hypothetical protein n=1 Tax=Sporosarcina sp. A2 TaxID=3393449 RepID=UPI003D78BF75